MRPEIIYEDNHIVAVNKMAGLLTQGDATAAPNLLDELKSLIKKRDSKPGNVFLGMVQRLDKPVSGVILFAKTSKAASRISQQIREKNVEKLYLAVTEKGDDPIEADRWIQHKDYLLRNKDKTEVAHSSDERAKKALLERKTIYRNDHFAVHLIRLITGRKHQIRAQLSHRAMPILGDVKYGAAKRRETDRIIQLHAIKCTFKHPTKLEHISLIADLPNYFLSCFHADEISRIDQKIKREIE